MSKKDTMLRISDYIYDLRCARNHFHNGILRLTGRCEFTPWPDVESTPRWLERLFFPVREFRGWRLSRAADKSWRKNIQVRAEMDEINRKRMERGFKETTFRHVIDGHPFPDDPTCNCCGMAIPENRY